MGESIALSLRLWTYQVSHEATCQRGLHYLRIVLVMHLYQWQAVTSAAAGMRFL